MLKDETGFRWDASTGPVALTSLFDEPSTQAAHALSAEAYTVVADHQFYPVTTDLFLQTTVNPVNLNPDIICPGVLDDIVECLLRQTE